MPKESERWERPSTDAEERRIMRRARRLATRAAKRSTHSEIPKKQDADLAGESGASHEYPSVPSAERERAAFKDVPVSRSLSKSQSETSIVGPVVDRQSSQGSEDDSESPSRWLAQFGHVEGKAKTSQVPPPNWDPDRNISRDYPVNNQALALESRGSFDKPIMRTGEYMASMNPVEELAMEKSSANFPFLQQRVHGCDAEAQPREASSQQRELEDRPSFVPNPKKHGRDEDFGLQSHKQHSVYHHSEMLGTATQRPREDFMPRQSLADLQPAAGKFQHAPQAIQATTSSTSAGGLEPRPFRFEPKDQDQLAVTSERAGGSDCHSGDRQTGAMGTSAAYEQPHYGQGFWTSPAAPRASGHSRQALHKSAPHGLAPVDHEEIPPASRDRTSDAVSGPSKTGEADPQGHRSEWEWPAMLRPEAQPSATDPFHDDWRLW